MAIAWFQSINQQLQDSTCIFSAKVKEAIIYFYPTLSTTVELLCVPRYLNFNVFQLCGCWIFWDIVTLFVEVCCVFWFGNFYYACTANRMGENCCVGCSGEPAGCVPGGHLAMRSRFRATHNIEVGSRHSYFVQVQVSTSQGHNEGGKGVHNAPGAESLAGAERSHFASIFFDTEHLHRKYLRFEHGGAKPFSCPGPHLISVRHCNHTTQTFAWLSKL